MKKALIWTVALSLFSLGLSGCALLPFSGITPRDNVSEAEQKTAASQEAAEGEKGSGTADAKDQEAGAPAEEPVEAAADPGQAQEAAPPALSAADLRSQAEHMALQYDYDGAIALLQSDPSYASNSDYQALTADYTARRDACVDYPLEEITHVFFHTLVVDPSLAFDGDAKSGGYNQVMTTISEFNKIIQSMYDRGFVMVSLHDMASVNPDGSMSRGSIRLPQGKKPFVLSQDDVSYYHYMDGDGYAKRLILTESGEVKNEYIEADGSVSVGDYDMVPLIDTFVDAHPDFAYHGHKGILAMTGYNGVLGYRTDSAYQTHQNLQENQQAFLDANPDFDYEADCAQAKAVASAMKADGWEFASHTWGHRNATQSTAEQLQVDNERWMQTVAPILGQTDVVIFAFGADIGDWQGYSEDNPKFAYFKSAGYNYYCNVDSSQYFVQITDRYLRQGRRNLDGYRMYYNPDMLSDLFTVSEVWDHSRPEPVPEM